MDCFLVLSICRVKKFVFFLFIDFAPYSFIVFVPVIYKVLIFFLFIVIHRIEATDDNPCKMSLQQYCLRWKYHHSNLQTMFSQLLDRGCFTDVTLACEGQLIKAHRVVLCACSTFFDSILTNRYTDKDPIVIMKDCKFEDIRCLIEFMYKGEINVEHVSILLLFAKDFRLLINLL